MLFPQPAERTALPPQFSASVYERPDRLLPQFSASVYFLGDESDRRDGDERGDGCVVISGDPCGDDLGDKGGDGC